jgi:hypothetical protein
MLVEMVYVDSTPAKAGVQLRPARCWTPTFAGVVELPL